MYEICDSLLKKNNIEIHTHSFTDINKAVSELISEFRHTHDRTQIFYHSSGPASEARQAFSFDLPMLKRTICNLINNSIEASHGSANIWITTSLEENFLKISVQDEGAGIQGNTLEMFERGFTTKPNGNGLGLSGAKQFIESNGGMITINKLEKGTLVNLMIPSSSTTQYFEQTTEQIVLIDDDPLVRFNWKRQGQKKNIIVNAFDSLDTFLAKKDLFPTNTPIFIDSNLGTERGEILSKRLYDLGFEDIVLTTAAPKNSIIETKWISSIVGKCFESALNSRRSSPSLGAFYID